MRDWPGGESQDEGGGISWLCMYKMSVIGLGFMACTAHDINTSRLTAVEVEAED
jgi:hypothetical protein